MPDHEPARSATAARCRRRSDYLVSVTHYVPMPLGHRREPFDHPDWIFELAAP
jgi:hypothetical protein